MHRSIDILLYKSISKQQYDEDDYLPLMSYKIKTKNINKRSNVA